jgi:hypothetical protein
MTRANQIPIGKAIASVPTTRRAVAPNKLASLLCSLHTLHARGVLSKSIHGKRRGMPTMTTSAANATRRTAAALGRRTPDSLEAK